MHHCHAAQALAGGLLSKVPSARPGARESLAALRICLPAPSRLDEHAERGGGGRAGGGAAGVAKSGQSSPDTHSQGAGKAGPAASAGGAEECFKVRWPAP